MKRLMKFGVILIALAVALAGCRTATGSSEVKEMTVNVGITDGTTELKAPVAIKGADFNAIKGKLVAKLDLTAAGTEHWFIAADKKIYTVDLGSFFSDTATTTQVQEADVKAGNTIYLKATAKTVPVTFAITDGTTKLKETSVNITSLDFDTVAVTVRSQLGISLGLGSGTTVTIDGATYTVDMTKLYSDVNATQEVSINNPIEAIKSGATIYMKATKNN